MPLTHAADLPGTRRLQWYGLQQTDVGSSAELRQHGNLFRHWSPDSSDQRQSWHISTWGATHPRRPRRRVSLGKRTHSVFSPPLLSTAWISTSKCFSLRRFSIAWATDFTWFRSSSLTLVSRGDCWLVVRGRFEVSFAHGVSFLSSILLFQSLFTSVLRRERNIKHGQSIWGPLPPASSKHCCSIVSWVPRAAQSHTHSTVHVPPTAPHKEAPEHGDTIMTNR